MRLLCFLYVNSAVCSLCVVTAGSEEPAALPLPGTDRSGAVGGRRAARPGCSVCRGRGGCQRRSRELHRCTKYICTLQKSHPGGRREQATAF